MVTADLWIVVRWWGTIFLVGAAAFPLTKQLFSSWYDHGYFFAKAVGLAVVGWIVLALGMARIAPFTSTTVLMVVAGMFVLGVVLHALSLDKTTNRVSGWVIVGEELFFFLALLAWSWVKAHEPSIRGLEKFMDYGFMNSILRSQYFPPADMWYPPESINYYYFGHLATALITKVSGLDLAYTFNLMLASIFAWTVTMSFSIGYQLWRSNRRIVAICSGVITAFLVTLAGNMQTLYAFTRGYTGDAVKPFWQLLWPMGEFWRRLPEGLETYWYANATRFIPYSIHEFPSYSFVVSDVHGHVLSLPFVLLAIGLLLVTFAGAGVKRTDPDSSTTHSWFGLISINTLVFYGFLVGVLLMTNALDGPIYLGIFLIVYFFTIGHSLESWKQKLVSMSIVVLSAVWSSLPFLIHFKSFVNGVALNCPPAFLANSHVGPLLFESVEKCQKSPFWMLWILWGFFWFCGVALIAAKIKSKAVGERRRNNSNINYLSVHSIYTLWNSKFTHTEKVLVICFLFAIVLIIFPEFFYFKDIYPTHFRSNTMFKLGYQAFILFSILSAYTIVWFLTQSKKLVPRMYRVAFFVLLMPQLFLVSLYPVFSVRSYFNSLRSYEGIYGLNWLLGQYPDDFGGIEWLRAYDAAHPLPGTQQSILLEADGESYSDYERYSVFTGIPTPIGWAVHEWLWRGTYDVVSPRREQVREMYESENVERTRALLDLYKVRYIVIGTFERQKFINLNERKFADMARVVYVHGETVIYERMNPRIDK
ncbi:hypothetical protein KBC80_03805 [Candidatus Woesebacteria bacterium]|nr:hypothetical protein [Candidatus Woesebacteria bacterium]